MADPLAQYNKWLTDDGPAALVIREYLMPVEGHDGVVFPPTFAAEQGNAPDRFPGGYSIDGDPIGENVCLIDTAPSQGNRIEPEFAKGQYAKLIPQVVVNAGARNVNLLEAGHRAGDAIIRCSTLQQELRDAFQDLLKPKDSASAEALAKIAPTSLVFGVWDSRDTGAKVHRLITSTIRAFNVRRLTRHGVYIPAAAYVDEDLLPEPQGKDNYAERGFKHQPITRPPDRTKPDPTHGGVIATGGIRRDATLSLAALRLLKVGEDPKKTQALQRYILGLSLVAFTHPSAFVGYLRQGCNLVRDPEKTAEFVEVYPDGRREAASTTHDVAIEYATAAANAFGVGENRTVEFDKKRAQADVAGDDKKKAKGKRKTQEAASTE